ncbi:uncharacterized protein L969DRAFT_95681 [Mixia osmundae IAM 14324]|uniref:Knr4/Smi1-like domain-containing protein n=1 Tax=Mixia osmundae (strain CBS 9802 / IAM 14324 / JCM 22182 / KY 12970) TaxID=764103 RepID=G7EAA6_MIXOS|nr:uncharacterized protein L969DRAFT_95681 [Mixia osmundae IAM 14324]KEI37825.1 hypothetical protein L969DRAFT_95681 [Mixia osmundae IAM 14324]GAA99766.1 hypothetical protein E5Q_06469 [Mixia osmundae IAM 14324]
MELNEPSRALTASRQNFAECSRRAAQRRPVLDRTGTPSRAQAASAVLKLLGPEAVSSTCRAADATARHARTSSLANRVIRPGLCIDGRTKAANNELLQISLCFDKRIRPASFNRAPAASSPRKPADASQSEYDDVRLSMDTRPTRSASQNHDPDSSLASSSSSRSDSSYPPEASQMDRAQTYAYPVYQSARTTRANGSTLSTSDNARNAAGSSYPSVKATFRRIEKILSSQYPELVDTLSLPCPSKEILDLQRLLGVGLLPRDLKDSLAIHDGQDVYSCSTTNTSGRSDLAPGRPGLVWGLWLMTAEEIHEEWDFWRKLEAANMAGHASHLVDDPFAPAFPRPASSSRSSASSTRAPTSETYDSVNNADGTSSTGIYVADDLDESRYNTTGQVMGSCPQGWVREHYSNPGWIPLLRDGGGNYIGIDLNPPQTTRVDDSDDDVTTPKADGPSPFVFPPKTSAGQMNAWKTLQALPGQVIAFGRDIDVKTVLFPGWGSEGGWARFLSSFADDLQANSFCTLDSSLRTDNDSDDSDDGIGSQTYADQGADFGLTFESIGRRATARTRESRSTGNQWRLRGRYKGMGIIEALCERSRQSWAQVGLYSAPVPRETSLREPLPKLRPQPTTTLDGSPDASPRVRTAVRAGSRDSSSSTSSRHQVGPSSKRPLRRPLPPVAPIDLPTSEDLHWRSDSPPSSLTMGNESQTRKSERSSREGHGVDLRPLGASNASSATLWQPQEQTVTEARSSFDDNVALAGYNDPFGSTNNLVGYPTSPNLSSPNLGFARSSSPGAQPLLLPSHSPGVSPSASPSASPQSLPLSSQ